MNFRQLNGKTIKQAFAEFHRENPDVYKAFEKEAFRAINAGRKKLSAKLIINFIRWNVFVETTDKNFKINDAMQSYYGRLFIALNPNHADKFECRKLRNEEDAPFMSVDSTGQISFL